MASTKGFNQVYAEAMELSNNSEALMDNLTKAAMAAGRLTAETKRDLEVFKQLRATTKDISTQLAEAGKRNLTSEAVALQQINDKILAQQKKLNGALQARLRISKDEKLTVEEKERKLASIDKQYQLQLEKLKKIEREEAQNAQKTKDRLRKLSREMDNLNSRAAGTIFDPTVGFFHSTGAELKDYDKTLEYMEKKNQDLADSFGDALSGSIDSMQSRFDVILRGGGNFLRDFASASRAAAEGNKRKREKGESVSKFQNLMGLMSKGAGILGTAGKMLAGFAAVAGGLFAIFKVVQALEEKIKEVNKELVDAYGATDLMYEGMEGTYEAINKARKEFTDADFAYEMGETLQGARGLVAQLNEMGINLRTTKGDFFQIKELTVGLKSASVALGTDFGTVTAFTQQFKEELGYAVKDGELLNKMGDSFARIRDVAMQSGFSTNRFFQVIQGLSDGIGEMNIRVGETSRMFFNMSKVLGPKAAQAFTQGLMGGFKGEGIQERFKRLILMGGSKKIMQRTASRTVKELGKQLTEGQAKLLSDSGIDLEGDLSKVTDAQLEKAMGNLRRQGGEGGRARAEELMRAVRLARGGSGGLSDQAMALGELDLSGTMSAQMKQLYAIQGDKGFQGITAIGMEKLVQMTGKSLDELEQMRKIDMAMRSDFAKVKEIQVMQDSQGNRLSPEEMKKVLKEQGFDQLTVNKEGQITDLAGNIIGDDLQSFIEAQGSDYDKMEKSTYDQLSLLAEVRDATMTSADMINNYLGDKIQDLNDPLEWIASQTGKSDQANRQLRKEAREKLKAEQENAQEQLAKYKESAKEELRKKERELGLESDGEKRAKIREEIDSLKTGQSIAIESMEGNLRLMSERRKAIASGAVEGASAEEINQNSRNVALRKLIQRGKTSQDFALKMGGGSEFEAQVAKIEGFENVAQMMRKTLEDTKFAEELKRKYNMDLTATDAVRSLENINGTSRLVERQQGVFTRGDERLSAGQEMMRSQKIRIYHGGADSYALPNNILREIQQANPEMMRNITFDSLKGRGVQGDASYGPTVTQAEFGDVDLQSRSLGEFSQIDNLANVNQEIASKQLSQLETLNQGLSILDPKNPKHQAAVSHLEKQKVDIIAKNRALFDRDKKMNVEAILDAKKQETEQALRSYGMLGKEGSLDDKSTLDSVIAKIDSEMNSITDKQSSRYLELAEQRQNIRKYYARDMESTPGMGKPLLFHNGYLVEGSANDSVSFTDRTKGGRGGGGMGGNTYNIIVPKGPAESQSAAIANGFRTAGHA